MLQGDIFWLFVEFVVLKWSVRPRVRVCFSLRIKWL